MMFIHTYLTWARGRARRPRSIRSTVRLHKDKIGLRSLAYGIWLLFIFLRSYASYIAKRRPKMVAPLRTRCPLSHKWQVVDTRHWSRTSETVERWRWWDRQCRVSTARVSTIAVCSTGGYVTGREKKLHSPPTFCMLISCSSKSTKAGRMDNKVSSSGRFCRAGSVVGMLSCFRLLRGGCSWLYN